nr:MAG TPA: hypothetical protein [Caudoviricetes sp.]
MVDCLLIVSKIVDLSTVFLIDFFSYIYAEACFIHI